MMGNRSGANLTSQLTTTQLGDLHVVEGALHCSGAPGPVVTSQRSESGPNYPQKKNKNNLTQLQKFQNFENFSEQELKAFIRKTIPSHVD